MGKKSKTLCEWKKSNYNAKSLLKVVAPPSHFCEKCGRVSNKKKILCEPKVLGIG
jgi:hypothetical protein